MLFKNRLVTKGLYSQKGRCGMLFWKETVYLRYHEASVDIRGQSSCTLNWNRSKACVKLYTEARLNRQIKAVFAKEMI